MLRIITLIISISFFALDSGIPRTDTISRAITNIEVSNGVIQIILNRNLVLDEFGEFYSDNIVADYYNKKWEKHAYGKIKSIGDLEFEYHGKTWEKHAYGKIKKIGQLEFEYHSKTWEKHACGKIKKIGELEFEYYGKQWEKHSYGKIKRIGDMEFQYHGGSLEDQAYGKPKKGKFFFVKNNIKFKVSNIKSTKLVAVSDSNIILKMNGSCFDVIYNSNNDNIVTTKVACPK